MGGCGAGSCCIVKIGKGCVVTAVLQRINEKWTVISLTLATLFWRIVFLGRADLWGDEILYAQRSSPPLSMWDVLSTHMDKFPELPYVPFPSMIQNVFLWLMKPYFGDVLHSAMAQRLPAAFFSALTVPFLYGLIRRLSNQRAAIFSCCMFAFFYFPLYFGREARFYAPLLFFIAASYWLYLRILQHQKLSVGSGIGLFLLSAGLCHITLNGVLFVAGMIGISGLSLVTGWGPEDHQRSAWRKLHGFLLGILVLGVVTFLPLLIPYLLEGAGLASNAVPPLPVLLRDIFGRMVMGASTVGWWVSFVLLLSGIIHLLVAKDKSYEKRVFLLAFFVIFLITLYKTFSDQYYFARLFYGLVPVVFWIFAGGVAAAAQFAGRLFADSDKQQERIFWGLAICLLGVHVLLYDPMLWMLQAKSNNYGGVARWLNEHLEPGTPYVMESGYQLRFVSGHYKTPGLVAACPYVHGPGAGEMQKLRVRQKEFLQRFPEAYWVESAFHSPPWSWPERYFEQQVVLENIPLKRLIQWGIEGQHFNIKRARYEVIVHYNTRDDILNGLRENGESIFVDYQGWQCVQFARYEYARYQNGIHHSVGLHNLNEKPVRGVFTIKSGIQCSTQQKVSLKVKIADNPPFVVERDPGVFFDMNTPVQVIPKGSSTMDISLHGCQPDEKSGLLVHSVVFTAQ